MNIFSEIERLITEHGSASILKERIALLRDQFDVLKSQKQVLEEEINILKAKIVTLEKEIQGLNEDNKNLEINNSNLQSQLDELHSPNPSNQRCDECGSINVKRTGARPHKTFGKFGVKDILYTCSDCGKVTAVMTDPPK